LPDSIAKRERGHPHDYDQNWKCTVPGCGYELPKNLRPPVMRQEPVLPRRKPEENVTWRE